MICLCRAWNTGETAAERDWRLHDGKVAPGDGSEEVPPPSAIDSRGSALLIGWYRCKARYLKKYSALYAELGYTVVPFDSHATVPPMVGCALCGGAKRRARSAYGSHAERALALIVEHDVRVVHVLSMGGCVFWSQVMLEAARRGDGALERVRGVVLDSCPSYTPSSGWPPSSLFWFLWANIRGVLGRALTLLLFPLMWVVITLSNAACCNYQCVPNSAAHEFWRQVERPHTHAACRYLVMYSKDDKICPWQRTEAFVQQLRKREDKPVVVAHDFTPSRHVQHLRLYPKLYKERVGELLDGVDSDLGASTLVPLLAVASSAGISDADADEGSSIVVVQDS